MQNYETPVQCKYYNITNVLQFVVVSIFIIYPYRCWYQLWAIWCIAHSGEGVWCVAIIVIFKQVVQTLLQRQRQRQRFIFLEVYRVQLGQVHDQHIHQVSNGYAYKFPFIYLAVGNHILHVFGLHGNETASWDATNISIACICRIMIQPFNVNIII